MAANFRLDGRCALVTGAGQGLGQAMAVALAEAGADVAGVDIAGVHETRAQVQGAGRRFTAITEDLRGPAALRRVVDQAAARQFLAQGGGGKIVNVASMLSFQGGIRVPSYTASKSGVLGLTRLLANEWAAKGINVNAIAPGYMATANTAPLRADAARSAEILARIPANRWGQPEDLAGAVVFLCSSASDYVHGSVIAVDGGWLAR
jgi:2-deoxy-D-gluconate 3-dehydrogenase